MRRLLMTALRTLELEDGPQPEIPPGWLRLDMTASGLGLTQLQLLSGSTSTGGLPRVLGHEMVGRVSELGAGVAAPAVGSLVVVDCLFGCGRCDRCLRGSRSARPLVRHPEFGEGEVIARQGTLVTVFFPLVGEKTLREDYLRAQD